MHEVASPDNVLHALTFVFAYKYVCTCAYTGPAVDGMKRRLSGDDVLSQKRLCMLTALQRLEELGKWARGGGVLNMGRCICVLLDTLQSAAVIHVA